MKATNVLAAAVLIGGGVAGCASMEAMPAAYVCGTHAPAGSFVS